MRDSTVSGSSTRYINNHIDMRENELNKDKDKDRVRESSLENFSKDNDRINKNKNKNNVPSKMVNKFNTTLKLDKAIKKNYSESALKVIHSQRSQVSSRNEKELFKDKDKEKDTNENTKLNRDNQ
eukprot:CAMPEP_0116907488 /NCGR_PEP_ID=MMETSP0467-20121206/13142_1 /TAXON_ID=283647 /ORGANISM="Mesodinium pulex, Strain SPMC105" /LENGTH=124 /DNA_ID=CAMNT_0004582529 /DNA_START=288 /DNA_END=662 /DNA_ORIENTATION=-